jgi:hypothetical protein
MDDLFARFAAANPVPECAAPSIEQVWSKVASQDAQPQPTPGQFRLRRPKRAQRVFPG